MTYNVLYSCCCSKHFLSAKCPVSLRTLLIIGSSDTQRCWEGIERVTCGGGVGYSVWLPVVNTGTFALLYRQGGGMWCG